jgi:hypothetical protein
MHASPPVRGASRVTVEAPSGATIKGVVQSQGVLHGEVDLILPDGEPVALQPCLPNEDERCLTLDP